MSARGARSRKVQQKNIEKTEKRPASKAKGKAPEAEYDTPDAFAQWRASPSVNGSRNGITRTLTVSSDNSRTTSHSSSTHDGGLGRSRLNTMQSNNSSDVRQGSGYGPPSVSEASSKGKEKTKFQAKGKETKAPRGRGGGVPIKKTVASSPAPPTFRTESAGSQPQSDQKSWANFKIWDGRKDGMRPYHGFSLDQDMQRGEVLIHLGEHQFDDDRPVPTIRAELRVLENSRSTWLANALAMGRIEEDDMNDWEMPNSSSSWVPSDHSPPNFQQTRQRKMLGPTSPGGRSPPPFDIDQTYGGLDSRTASRAHHISEVARTDRSDSPAPLSRGDLQTTTHQIWFPAPSNIKSLHGQRLHHLGIRNFLAILHGKPIVGADLFEMLDTLQAAIVVMHDLDNDDQSGLAPSERSVQIITKCLEQHGLEDVRNNLGHALGLLLWSEQDNVKWRQGYLESFVHLAGIMTPEVEELAEFKRLSVVTRRNLGLSGKTLQLRIMEAEERLSGFDFADLWEGNPKIANSPVYQHYQLFRQFLVGHYQRIHGDWPPASGKTWLNRKITQSMQEDFGSLYDYLVNREVFWNPREERASRKWEMAHRKMEGFTADLPELGITDMLVMFDAKQGYTHIPHSYPLLPREVPKVGKDKEKKSFFSSLMRDKTKDITRDAKAHLQLSIVFSDATNIEKLDVNFNGSTLIDKFEQFELTTDLKHATPREARLGRWVLLYGILQVLSTLSVDVQGLKHTDGVRYFLCTDLKRIPEWVTNGQLEHLEASQHRSWCWQRAWDPKPAQTAPVELEAPLSTGRNRAASRHEAEYFAHSFPTPPPQGALPAPPAFDGTTTMANDIRRIGEKIDSLSLSHNATNLLRQDIQRRRENEKSMQATFHDRKPPLSQPVQNTTALRTPSRLDLLPRHMHHDVAPPPPRSTSRLTHNNANTNDTHESLTELDYHELELERQLRSGITSLNTDLGAYPFSQHETAWPVPPRYHEDDEDELGGGHETVGHGEFEIEESREGKGRSYRESSVLGGGYEEWTMEDRRSPRMVHEAGGW
ncbi:hypothetical protein T440DRAFT_549986 [Plenodomus tracheiphilus IPT5]|uniref:DUF8004 domain-containing protein n=1 Tax=Plenodomus tracheiphilus IPT5 TaxID=1408161 RepID=A0A6A7BN52_9PLEO|nr:hypothetical protein T440DRAFT_549986 [Plenodomus tracheiphilus IPT5]